MARNTLRFVFRRFRPPPCTAIEFGSSCAVIEASPLSMPTMGTRLRRNLLALRRRVREYRMLADGVRSTDHPVLAHIIATRRCNLACTYCNEYDDYSKPV